jgi:hypothetical protein
MRAPTGSRTPAPRAERLSARVVADGASPPPAGPEPHGGAGPGVTGQAGTRLGDALVHVGGCLFLALARAGGRCSGHALGRSRSSSASRALAALGMSWLLSVASPAPLVAGAAAFVFPPD